MWAILDIFIVLTSLWEVGVDILQAVYQQLDASLKFFPLDMGHASRLSVHDVCLVVPY